MRVIFVIFCLIFSKASFADNRETLTFSNYLEVNFINADIPDLLKLAFNDAGYHLDFEENTIKTGFQKSYSLELDGMILGSFINGVRLRDDNLDAIPVTLATQKFYAFFRSDMVCPDSMDQLSDYTFLKYDQADTINQYMSLHHPSKTISSKNVLETINIIRNDDSFEYMLINHDAFEYMIDLAGSYLKICFEQPILEIQFQPLIHKSHGIKIPALTKSLKQTFENYKKGLIYF